MEIEDTPFAVTEIKTAHTDVLYYPLERYVPQLQYQEVLITKVVLLTKIVSHKLLKKQLDYENVQEKLA